MKHSIMKYRKQLKKEINPKAVVHGKVLTSRKEANYCVNPRRFTLDFVAALYHGQVMLNLTKDLNYKAIGGPTWSADSVAIAMMQVTVQQGRKID